MPSLGEGGLYVSNQQHGVVRVQYLHAARSLYPCLGLSLELELHHLPESVSNIKPPLRSFELRDLSGELRVGEHDGVVGAARWAANRRYVRSSDLRSSIQVPMMIDLDRSRLERMEEKRNGKAPRFWLSLWPMLVQESGFVDAEIATIQFTVPIETWVAILGEMQLKTYDVIEVPFALPGPKFHKAVSHLDDARVKFDLGMFDEAAGLCRKALEAAAIACGVPKNSDWTAAFAKARQERVASELGGIASRLKQLSGFAIHDMNQPAPDYTRAEAQFIMKATGAFIGLVAAQLAGRE